MNTNSLSLDSSFKPLTFFSISKAYIFYWLKTFINYWVNFYINKKHNLFLTCCIFEGYYKQDYKDGPGRYTKYLFKFQSRLTFIYS